MQIQPTGIGIRPTPAAAPTGGAGTTGFVQTLTDALKEVNKLQSQATGQAEAAMKGGGPPLEAVMSDLEEAQLAFQATMQFRNKAIEAYQDVMRMQF